MTDYEYEAVEEAEAPAPKRRRFDPTRERGAEFFVRAHRHSRLVRSLKFILPTIAIAGVAGFFIVMESGGSIDGGAAVISLSGINVESKSLVMQNPNISGFQGTKHSYEVVAAEAVQDLRNPKVATLNKLTATFKVGGGETAVVNATTGVMDSETKILVLSKGITMKTSNGYTARFEDARINMDKGDLSSDKPIEISAAAGTIKANGIEVTDRGAHVKFLNGVTVNYIPGQLPAGDDKGVADAAKEKSTKATDKKPAFANANETDAPNVRTADKTGAKMANPVKAAEPGAATMVNVEADAAPIPVPRPDGGPKKKKDKAAAPAGTVPAGDEPAKTADGDS